MDSLLITLRIIHVIFGIYLAGSYLFIVPILEPRLKRLGPAIQGPVMRAIVPIMSPVNGISFIIVIITGVAMTLILRWGSLGTLLVSGWGWAIIIGTVATLVVVVVGFGLLTPTGMRLDKLGRSIEGRAPTPSEAQELQRLSARMDFLSRLNLVFVLIALATMLSARYL